MNTTALYVRVSTADQKHDSQLGELKAFCQMRGWSDLVYYVETESGAKTSRPKLDSLMKDLRTGKARRVVCFKLDRLGRSLTHLALILDEMTRLRVPLICTSQGIDTGDDNPAGRLQLGVLMAVAEFERSLIRERVNAGLRAAKSRGVKLGRPEKLKQSIDVVLRLRKAGKGLREIGRELGMPPSSVSKIVKMSG